jgi:hypothetical protein
MGEKFVVYENWRVRPKKAVVHHSTCSFANRDQNIREKIEDNCLINTHSPNDRWYGYFKSVNEAMAFGSLLPNRQLKLCGVCLKKIKDDLFLSLIHI